MDKRQALYNKADALYDKKEYAKALLLFRRALCKENREDCYTCIGLCYYHLGMLCSAALVFKKLIQENPSWFFPVVNLGRVYMKLKRYRTAENLFKKAMNIDPESEEPYFYSGLLYQEVGHFHKAIRYYKKALKVVDVLGETHFNLGSCLFRVQQYDEALKEFFISIRLKHREENAYYGIGVTYRFMGQYEKSLEFLTKAYDINKKSISTICMLAETCYLIGDVNRSKELYHELSLLSPEEIEVLKKRKIFGKIYEAVNNSKRI